MTAMENLETASRSTELPASVNTTAKDDLLRRARSAIEAGAHSFHDAAEALVVAKELHGATQAEMARAIGKYAAWVSLLLKWHRSNDNDQSPFGPTTKAGRLKHAKDRVAADASKPRKSRHASVEAEPDAGDAEFSAAKRQPEYERSGTEGNSGPEKAATAPGEKTGADSQKSAATPEVEGGKAISSAPRSLTAPRHTPTAAKKELRFAIDHWWPLLDDDGRVEMTSYLDRKRVV